MSTIRIAEPADAREVAGIYGPIVAHTATSFETEVPTEMEMESEDNVTIAECAPQIVNASSSGSASSASGCRRRASASATGPRRSSCARSAPS